MSARPSARSPELLRVGDRERAEAADRLSAHAVAGRLSIDELEQRLETLHSAVYARDLHAVEADLPSAVRRPGPYRPAPLVPVAIAALLAAVFATIAAGHPIPPLFIAAVLLWRRALAQAQRPELCDSA
jgi:Domain of unknown function (DUF1707)